jgi:predicted dehydrogenase
VVTGNPGRQREARERYPNAAIVSSAEQLWERAEELDLVVVATPNRTHVPLAEAALSAGLPVVVDKPLATSAADARSLVKAAAERDLLLTVFHNRRWDGDFLTLEQLIADGALGSVQRFESRFERWRPAVVAGWRELPSADEGGGVLYDLGSHLIDQALRLFGEVDDVYAEIDRRRPGAKVDDDVFCALTHASGVRSHLWASSVAADRGPRMRVLGSRAAYVKHGLDVQEAQLRDGRSPGQPGWGEEPEDAWGVLEADGERRPVPTRRGAYEEFYGALVAALRGERPPPVDPGDAIAVVEIIAAARDYAAR